MNCVVCKERIGLHDPRVDLVDFGVSNVGSAHYGCFLRWATEKVNVHDEEKQTQARGTDMMTVAHY